MAILIEALTDNRNRTAADLRAAFSKNGGNLGETGCVSWMFAQKGVVRFLTYERYTNIPFEEEEVLELCLEVDADSYELTEVDDEKAIELFTDVGNLETLSQTLKEKGYAVEAEIRWIPNNTVEVNDRDRARSLLKLIDTLESLDDVQNVTANFEMADQLMALSVV